MSFPDENRSSPSDGSPFDDERPASSMPADGARPRPSGEVPRTRTGMAWVGVFVAAILGIALVVFMAQNTRRVEVSFLWMSTPTPLSIALLIAAVGSVMLTLILGSARILQLRRVVRKQRG